MENPKAELYRFCDNQSSTKLLIIKNRLKSLVDSMDSETKSSAGDKHETGRAMLQLEREKLGIQLQEAEKTIQLLNSVKLDSASSNIHLGSLVHTSGDSYFIAISAGKYIMEGQNIFCISPMTPIGRLLIGKSKGDTLTFNDHQIKIEEIL